MKLTALISFALIAAGPAHANYGDMEMQLDHLTSAMVSITQPVQTPSHVVATAETCSLPSEHIVSVPASFTQEASVEMACLTE